MGELDLWGFDEDEEVVILSSVFPESPIIVVSALKYDEQPLMIQGPEEQIDFLARFVPKMVDFSSFTEENFQWVGLQRKSRRRLDLFYRFGDSLQERFKLVTEIFRSDIILRSDIELKKSSEFEIVLEGKQVLGLEIRLPVGLKNGTIRVPPVREATH